MSRDNASALPHASVLAIAFVLVSAAGIGPAVATPSKEHGEGAPNAESRVADFGPSVRRVAAEAYASAGLFNPPPAALRTDLLRLTIRSYRAPESISPPFGIAASRSLTPPHLPESVVIQAEPWSVEKNFWLASGEVLLVQLIPWSVNAYVRGEDWAKNIGFESWLDNLVNGWEWDDNQFVNNQFSHPYHGNLYFNAGRSNGYNYWESSAFAWAGSWMWEMFGETFRPAINDWVMTSMGGMVLGEMTYRLSSTILDNTKNGWARTRREAAAFLVNPTRGFTRLVTGRSGRQGINPSDRFPRHMRSTINLGARAVRQVDIEGSRLGNGLFSFELDYGDPFQGENKKPFDSFEIRLQVDFGDNGGIGQLTVDALLHATELNWSQNNQHQFSVYQHFTYYNTAGFEIGGQTFGAGLASLFPFGNNSEIRTRAEGGVVVLGAINSEHADQVGRTYDYGPGAALNLRGELWRKGFPLLRLSYRGIWIHTVNGADGDHWTQVLALRLGLPLIGRLAVGADLTAVRRDSFFTDFSDVHRKDAAARLYFIWRTKE